MEISCRNSIVEDGEFKESSSNKIILTGSSSNGNWSMSILMALIGQ